MHVRCLPEHLGLEEPETREWTVIMAAINIGALLKYGWPQGLLRRANVLGAPSHGLLALHFSLYML
jgi:hypothetical protein